MSDISKKERKEIAMKIVLWESKEKKKYFLPKKVIHETKAERIDSQNSPNLTMLVQQIQFELFRQIVWLEIKGRDVDVSPQRKEKRKKHHTPTYITCSHFNCPY